MNNQLGIKGILVPLLPLFFLFLLVLLYPSEAGEIYRNNYIVDDFALLVVLLLIIIYISKNGFSFNYLNDNETIHMLNQLPNLFNSEWYIRAKEKCLKLAKLNFDPQQKTAELIEKLNGI